MLPIGSEGITLVRLIYLYALEKRVSVHKADLRGRPMLPPRAIYGLSHNYRELMFIY